jgi:hypothetical protein
VSAASVPLVRRPSFEIAVYANVDIGFLQSG